MGRFLAAILALALLWVGIRLLMKAPPRTVAQVLRYGSAVAVMVVGAVLTFSGRGALGLPAIALSLGLLGRAYRSGAAVARGGQKSRVQTQALLMELDLDTGEMSGLVLAGEREGAELRALDEDELLHLHREFASYPESRDLLETYLDRRMPDWRARADTHESAGLGTAPGTGPMTEEEAYKILGLAPGAGEADIRQAHRRLMKRMHPDTGGSAFLAARLNEAKEFLMRRHV